MLLFTPRFKYEAACHDYISVQEPWVSVRVRVRARVRVRVRVRARARVRVKVRARVRVRVRVSGRSCLEGTRRARGRAER